MGTVDLQVVDGGGQGEELGKFWGRRGRNFSGMREVERGMVEEEIGTASEVGAREGVVRWSEKGGEGEKFGILTGLLGEEIPEWEGKFAGDGGGTWRI